MTILLIFLASQHAAEKAGGGAQGAKSAASSSLFGMTLDEAKQILNVSDPASAEQVLKVFIFLSVIFVCVNVQICT